MPPRTESASLRSPHRHLSPEIAAIFRQARLARRWSYRWAFKETGVPFGYLCMLEGGKRVPSIVVAEVLIEGYGLTYVEADLVRSAALHDVGRDSRPPGNSSNGFRNAR
jgi:hypothetical protein